MAGWLNSIRNPLGRALNAVHRAGGKQMDYTLVIDTTTNPMTTVTLSGIHYQPTPIVRIQEQSGGVLREIMSSAGNLSADLFPVFKLSRPVLISGGVQYEPTFYDTFIRGGETQVFYIAQITDLSNIAEGWRIVGTTDFRLSAVGFGRS